MGEQAIEARRRIVVHADRIKKSVNGCYQKSPGATVRVLLANQNPPNSGWFERIGGLGLALLHCWLLWSHREIVAVQGARLVLLDDRWRR